MSLVIHDCIQGSDAWRELRRGKMTASNAQAIGNNGKGLDTYILSVMSEKYAKVQEDSYTNIHMDRGNELEDQARTMYELEQGVTVEQVGFIALNDYVGCSPDGLIAEDGGLEIKCLNNSKHFNVILSGLKAVDSKYIWQVQMNLLITKRKWWDLVLYNPNYQQSLLVFRIRPDKEAHKKLREGFRIGTKKIKEIEKDLNKN